MMALSATIYRVCSSAGLKSSYLGLGSFMPEVGRRHGGPDSNRHGGLSGGLAKRVVVGSHATGTGGLGDSDKEREF